MKARSQVATDPELARLVEVLVDVVLHRIEGREVAVREGPIDQNCLPVGVSRRSYLHAARTGALSTQKVGRSVQCTRRELERWIAAQARAPKKVSPAPPAPAAASSSLEEILRRNGLRKVG